MDPETIHPNGKTEAQVQEQLRSARGVLGAAGHEVTDPVLIDLLEREARGLIDGDEARALGRAHILAKRRPSDS